MITEYPHAANVRIFRRSQTTRCDRRRSAIPRSQGAPTSLGNLTLLCAFHHLIAVHRWGWELTLHPDATTTATSPDGLRTLHSHGPPARAA